MRAWVNSINRETATPGRDSALRLAALLGLLLALGCNSSIQWKNHMAFRSYGKSITLSQIDPKEQLHGAIRANLDYVSVALDSVFFRDLPGMVGRQVAFGLELLGALPDGTPVKTVMDLAEPRGDNAFLSFNNAVMVKPFLYTGRNITIRLHFKTVARSAAANVMGRIQAAQDSLKTIEPTSMAGRDLGLALFSTVMPVFSKKEQHWKYQFTLYPAESTMRDKPEMLFTAARHILICLPPANAPGAYKAIKPRLLLRMLNLQGNRLVWKQSRRAYTTTPYIVLNVVRYRRYPSSATRLKQLVKKVDDLTENGNYKLALAGIANLGAAINEDRVITETEKNLQRAWQDYRQARVRMLMEKREALQQGTAGNDAGARLAEGRVLKQVLAQLRYLGDIRSQFAQVLYPYEVKRIQYRLGRLTLEAKRLSRALNAPPAQAALVAQVVMEVKTQIGKAKPVLKIKKVPKPRPLPKIVLPSEDMLAAISHKPLVKKWWFWTLIGLAAAGVGSTAIYYLTRQAEAPFYNRLGVPVGPYGP